MKDLEPIQVMVKRYWLARDDYKLPVVQRKVNGEVFFREDQSRNNYFEFKIFTLFIHHKSFIW